MKLINDNNDSNFIKVKLNNYISCSFNQNSKFFNQANHKLDLKENNPYRAIHANRTKVFVCYDPNTTMSFWDIYKSPRNALSDSASCIQILNRDCKTMPEQVMEEIYSLKIQLTKILYEDHKCIRASRELDINHKFSISVGFEIDNNFYCWHVPEYSVSFKNCINNIDNSIKLKPLYCTPNVKHMTFGRMKALTAWVISNWKDQ